MKRVIWIRVLIGVLAIAACGARATATPEASLPNPASVFCENETIKSEVIVKLMGSLQEGKHILKLEDHPAVTLEKEGE